VRPAALVSVVIPHRNTPEALRRCIDALERGCAGLEHELLVVDNGSDTESMATSASEGRRRVLRNGTNRGFAAACNQAAAVACGHYLLFLNSDVEVDAHSIARLVNALESDASLAGIAPLQRDADGGTQSPAREWLSPMTQALALLGHARVRSARPAIAARVDVAPWVTAAALLVRRRAFSLVGGFDEGYFFYEEDEDLGWRLARRGCRLAVCHGATVLHHGGLSTGVAGAWPVLALYAGQARFVRRRCGLGGELLYRLSTFLAIAIKAVIGRLRGRVAPSLARATPSRVLRLLCSRRMQIPIVAE
jgi:GT2 family glycosyltransferase